MHVCETFLVESVCWDGVPCVIHPNEEVKFGFLLHSATVNTTTRHYNQLRRQQPIRSTTMRRKPSSVLPLVGAILTATSVFSPQTTTQSFVDSFVLYRTPSWSFQRITATTASPTATTTTKTEMRDAATSTAEKSSAAPYRAPSSEIDRRRNLAIISHPDSGKTTMTEKLLLYGGTFPAYKLMML